MKKYFQISFFLGIFAILVVFKQVRGSESTQIVGNKNNSQFLNVPSPTSTPTQNSSNSSPQTMMPNQMPKMGMYKDGNYTGSVADAFYGNIQVQAKISNGKIVDVVFLQYPHDNRTSISINSQADPMLTQEAIQAQSANVDIISGASASSQAFQQSLADALSQAKQ